MTKSDEEWMREALGDAEAAMEYAEIPVASILVGDGLEITRAQTQVRRRGSIAAHGELYAILDAKASIYEYADLTIYTTLEPCLMCVGACLQAGVKHVVFGMRAAPDGAASLSSAIRDSGQPAAEIEGGLLEEDSVALMVTFRERFPDSPAIPYVNAMLAEYGK